MGEHRCVPPGKEGRDDNRLRCAASEGAALLAFSNRFGRGSGADAATGAQNTALRQLSFFVFLADSSGFSNSFQRIDILRRPTVPSLVGRHGGRLLPYGLYLRTRPWLSILPVLADPPGTNAVPS